MGRKSGFVQRNSKLTASTFLNVLLFAHKPGRQTSLLDMTADLYEQFGIRFTKQSLQERFNARAVLLLKEVLSRLLGQHLPSVYCKGLLEGFNRVRIKDSTRFALPEAYAPNYKGYGGVTRNSASMISIQCEYDLLSGQTMDLRLTNGLCNDQADSRDFTMDIQQGDLFIRDLGYCTMDYMSKLSNKGAYFLNRLAPKVKVYHAEDPDRELDVDHCLKKLKKHQLPHLEYRVLMGKEAKLPARLIISAVDQAIYERRVRKTRKRARSCGHQTSDQFRTRAKANIFVTNAPAQQLSASRVQSAYGLRWQIELIFKIWKSQAKINDIKEVKIHRFECHLLGQVIWLLLHWKLYWWLNHRLTKQNGRVRISPWKYYKFAYRSAAKLRRIALEIDPPEGYIKSIIGIPIQLLVLEKKNNKNSNIYELLSLN